MKGENLMKKYLVNIIVVCIMCVLLLPSSVYAQNTTETFENLSDGRSADDQKELRGIYKKLFPEQYSYIESYEKYGIIEMDSNQIDILFNETKRLNNSRYTLIVYNNGQIFTNIVEESSNNGITPYAYDTKQVTETFKLGDVGHYVTITVTYTVQYQWDDWIDSYSTGGSGFYLYPQCRRYKKYEDSSGNAYIGYHNVSMNYDGSGVLYDLGVSVGDDRAVGITRLSTGLDAFITYMLNPFLFG